MSDVYIVWKDYGGGDYSMIAVHSSERGASECLRKEFFNAKSDGFKPFWTDGRLHEEDHTSFNSDSYELEVKKVPLLP